MPIFMLIYLLCKETVTCQILNLLVIHQEGVHVVHQGLHGGLRPQRHPEELDYWKYHQRP